MMRATNVLAVDLARENEQLRARVAELEARLAEPERVSVGAYVVDLTTGDVWDGDEIVSELSPVERRLFGLLAASPGSPVRYEWIGNRLWPGAARKDVIRATAVNLSRMRMKIDRTEITDYASGSRSRHFRTLDRYGLAFMP